jgi:hypothetical protein
MVASGAAAGRMSPCREPPVKRAGDHAVRLYFFRTPVSQAFLLSGLLSSGCAAGNHRPARFAGEMARTFICPAAEMPACPRDHLNAPVRILDTGALLDPPPSMTEPAAPIPPSKTQTVDFCLPCVKCWYDLRGIGVRERCPECGTPVSRTMRSLFASELGYLNRLHRKLVWLQAIPVLLFIIGAAAIMTGPGYVEFWVGQLAVGKWHLLLLSIPLVIRSAVLLSEVFKAEGRVPRVESNQKDWRPALTNWMFGYVAGFVLGGWVFAGAHRAPGFYEQIQLIACLGAWLWPVRNLVLAPHLRRMCRRLGLKGAGRGPWVWATCVAMCMLGCTVAYLNRYEGRDPLTLATILLAVFTVGSLLSILWRCQKKVSAVIRFRESEGRVLPRDAR